MPCMLCCELQHAWQGKHGSKAQGREVKRAGKSQEGDDVKRGWDKQDAWAALGARVHGGRVVKKAWDGRTGGQGAQRLAPQQRECARGLAVGQAEAGGPPTEQVVSIGGVGSAAGWSPFKTLVLGACRAK